MHPTELLVFRHDVISEIWSMGAQNVTRDSIVEYIQWQSHEVKIYKPSAATYILQHPEAHIKPRQQNPQATNGASKNRQGNRELNSYFGLVMLQVFPS